MRIKRICYPVTALGPGKRVGIWTVGCRRQCPGCMSPELRDPDSGREMTPEQILRAVQNCEPVEGITISGGEPFDQPQALLETVRLLSAEVTNDIIIYTGYTMEALQAEIPTVLQEILGRIAVLVDGEYVEKLNDGKGLRGSSNQRIHVFRDPEKYAYMEHCERTLQIFEYKETFSLMIGIL